MSWGSNAIDIRGPRIPPTFNYQVVGGGKAHENKSSSFDRLVFELELCTYSAYNIYRETLYSPSKSVPAFCLIDTGTAESYFSPEVARLLDIVPPQRDVYPDDGKQVSSAFQDVVYLQDGTIFSLWWFRQIIGVKIGVEAINVSVRFPLHRVVRATGPAFVLHQGVPPNAISRLGLRGLLDNRMLCLTPETAFAMARKHP